MVVRSSGRTTAYWILAAVLVILIFLGVWAFLKRSEQPGKRNPAQSGLQSFDGQSLLFKPRLDVRAC